MKRILIIILLLSPSLLFAQQVKRYVKKGNDLYKQQKFKEAEENYRKSFGKKGPGTEADFNLGDALYKQKKFGEAAEQFNKIGAAGNQNKALSAQAYHNLGNTYLSNKKLEEGIAAYKKALINNPNDDETRYNLAYAQEMLKQQQNKDKKNKDKNKDRNKDQSKDKKDPDKDKKDQDKKDQDKKDQDKKNQDKNGQDKKDDQPGQKPQPDKVSKEDAQRMLDALNNAEKQTQDKLKNKKVKGEKVRISKDW
jgi:Ca-activated chloride channel family protein